MKQNRDAIYITLPLTVVALIVSYIFSCIKFDYGYNIALGVFGSALLAFIIATINYRVDKRVCLEAFYKCAMKFRNKLNRYQSSGEFEQRVVILLRIYEFDFSALDDAYGSLYFLFGNKVKKKIYETVYNPILKVRKELRNTSFHLETNKNARSGNRNAVESVLDKFDAYVMATNIHSQQTENDDFYYKESFNRIVRELDKSLDNYYYEILYPNKKREK